VRRDKGFPRALFSRSFCYLLLEFRFGLALETTQGNLPVAIPMNMDGVADYVGRPLLAPVPYSIQDRRIAARSLFDPSGNCCNLIAGLAKRSRRDHCVSKLRTMPSLQNRRIEALGASVTTTIFELGHSSAAKRCGGYGSVICLGNFSV